jgi:hypothetical protein
MREEVYFEKYENLEVYIGNSTSREVYFRSFPINRATGPDLS